MKDTPPAVSNLPLISSWTISQQQKGAIVLLSAMYGFGMLGIGLPIHEDFALLTPLNLIVSLAVALAFHREWQLHTFIFLGLCYVVGFGAELFGVQTGLLFGDYAYGEVLGWKVGGTPLMIGINWMLLAYCGGATINLLLPRLHWTLKALAAAGALVLLDLFIEPVAIQYGFWSWELAEPPLQNYLGWFLVALPLQAYFAYFQGGVTNKVAVALFILQFLFFLFLGLIN